MIASLLSTAELVLGIVLGGVLILFPFYVFARAVVRILGEAKAAFVDAALACRRAMEQFEETAEKAEKHMDDGESWRG